MNNAPIDLLVQVEALGFDHGNPQLFVALNGVQGLEFTKICGVWTKKTPKREILEAELQIVLDTVWEVEARKLGFDRTFSNGRVLQEKINLP